MRWALWQRISSLARRRKSLAANSSPRLQLNHPTSSRRFQILRLSTSASWTHLSQPQTASSCLQLNLWTHWCKRASKARQTSRMQSSGRKLIRTVSRFRQSICTHTGRNRSRRQSSKRSQRSTSLRESRRCIEEGTVQTHQKHHSYRKVDLAQHNGDMRGTSSKAGHSHYPVKEVRSSWIFLQTQKCSASASLSNSRCHHCQQQILKDLPSQVPQRRALIRWTRIPELGTMAFVSTRRLPMSRLYPTSSSLKLRTFQRQTKTISQTLKSQVGALRRSVLSEAQATSVICQR